MHASSRLCILLCLRCQSFVMGIAMCVVVFVAVLVGLFVPVFVAVFVALFVALFVAAFVSPARILCGPFPPPTTSLSPVGWSYRYHTSITSARRRRFF